MDVRAENKKKRNGSPLIGMILLTVLLLQAYGFLLERCGYNNRTVQGCGEKVALAILGIREGYCPWNQKEAAEWEELSEGDLEEITVNHSNRLAMAGLAGEADAWGLKELSENATVAVTDRNVGDFVKNHLMDHSLMEEYMEHAASELPTETVEEVLPETVIGEVDEDYFADAVFIGDSRMVGVMEYAGLDQATFLAKISMTIYGMMDTKVSFQGRNETVRNVLTNHQFGKIYLMVGINELGTANTEYFIRAYTRVIEEIRQLQPDAVIIIQAILHVTGEKDREDDIFNNENIDEKNEALKALANSLNIFYIDVNEVYDDENGNLRQELSGDDVHLFGNCYGPWHDFLMEHGVVSVNVTD
ncbi:MAG: GDSL-type esterase/lipase family protein [Lachnospiraceae bacterium]